MRALLRLGIAAAALALTSPAAAATIDLRISLWPRGRGTPGRESFTLRCAPAGGTLPSPGAACRRLARLRDPFAPVPPGAVCSQIYRGPEQALVVGSFRGQSVHTLFKRTDSCQTARWNRVGFLLQPTPNA